MDVERIRGLIRDNKLIRFYCSTTWEHLRLEVLDEQHHECQMCKDKGIAETATVCHHILHVRQHPELALTKSNLITVCDSHHWYLHHSIQCKTLLNEERW